MNADDVHYLGDETLSCNLFTYCMNNIVNNLDWNGKGLHLGKHWYNSKTWIMRFVAIAIAFTGFSFSGFISKGIIKGVKGMSKAVVRDLKYKVKNKLQKIVYLIARKMQRNVIKSAVSSQINRLRLPIPKMGFAP